MPSSHFLFVGFEVSDDVQKRLDECAQRDKVFLEDPTFLQRLTIGNSQYIGKKAENGLSLDRIEDTARSVVSLLSRIDSSWVSKSGKALVVPVENSGPAENGSFEYSELV